MPKWPVTLARNTQKPHMRQDFVVDALRMAWFRRRPAPGLIMHSDRGSQPSTAARRSGEL